MSRSRLRQQPYKCAIVCCCIHRLIDHFPVTVVRKHNGSFATTKSSQYYSLSKKNKLSFLEQTSIQLVLTEIKKQRSLTDFRLRRILHRAVCAKKKMKKTEARQMGLSWNFPSKTKILAIGRNGQMPSMRM